MKKLFWFTNENGDNCIYDYHGTLKGAVKVAEKYASENNETIYINEGEDIVDVVEP